MSAVDGRSVWRDPKAGGASRAAGIGMTGSELFGDPRALRSLEENLWDLWSRFGQGDGSVLHGDRGVSWFVHPSARPIDLAARLSARGLREIATLRSRTLPLRAAPAPEPAPSGIVFREAIGPSGYEVVLGLAAERPGRVAGPARRREPSACSVRARPCAVGSRGVVKSLSRRCF